jgi:hypothetical protein
MADSGSAAFRLLCFFCLFAVGGRPRETGDISCDVFSRDWAADQLAQGWLPLGSGARRGGFHARAAPGFTSIFLADLGEYDNCRLPSRSNCCHVQQVSAYQLNMDGQAEAAT